MYSKHVPKQEIESNWRFRTVLVASAFFIVFSGLFPGWLIDKLYIFF